MFDRAQFDRAAAVANGSLAAAAAVRGRQVTAAADDCSSEGDSGSSAVRPLILFLCAISWRERVPWLLSAALVRK